MRKLLLLLTIGLLAVPLALAAALFLAIEDRPRIDRQVILTPEHVERAMRIIDTHRYQVRPGMLATVKVLAEDADLAANYLVRRFTRGSAQIILADHNARVRLSLPLSGNLPGAYLNPYLNLEATLLETGGLPQLRSVRIGQLPLPDSFTDWLTSRLMNWLQRDPQYGAGLGALQRVKMSQDELSVVYRWNGGFSQGMQASMLGERERARLLHYQSLLAEDSRRGTAVVPLAQVLPPLLRLAAARSANGEALAENRAAILVATFHVLDMPLKEIVPEAAAWPQPTSQTVTVDGRDDLAKHFMVSAAIAAYADTALSDAVGLYKEIEDSRSGSGFSFNDIAADRAGTRFGERAVANAASAQRLQQRVAAGLTDADLMPPWADLPEFLPEAEFKRRFGGIDAPAYRQMMREIERRIAALQLLH